MRTTQEPCNSQGKYIMCCEWFNNLRIGKNEDEKQSYIKIITFQKNKVTSCVLVDSFLLNIITYQKTKL